MKKIIYSVLLISMMTLIFILSNQEAVKSTKVSDGLIERTIGNIYKIFDKDVNSEKLTEIKSIYAFPVRKLAHVTIYFILGILSILLVNEFNIIDKKEILIAFLICLLYSISDEIHQLFVIGRSGEIRDVILDSCGSFIGIVFAKKFFLKKSLK